MRESSMSETELKLSTLSEHIGNLRQAIESMGINSSPAVSTLIASYYDSADLKLWRQGLRLRVRDEGGRQVQTLKSSDFHRETFCPG
jgi:inorganic triphosphatase YgiF